MSKKGNIFSFDEKEDDGEEEPRNLALDKALTPSLTSDSKTCPVCFEQYTRLTRAPISMNCGHTFCAACIPSLLPAAARTRSAIGDGPESISSMFSLTCGICRSVTFSHPKKLGKNLLLLDYMSENNDLVDTDSEEDDEEEERSENNSVQFVRRRRKGQQPAANEVGNTDCFELGDPTHLLELLHQFHLTEQTLEGIVSLRGGAITTAQTQQFAVELNELRESLDRELQDLTHRFQFAEHRLKLNRIMEKIDSTYEQALLGFDHHHQYDTSFRSNRITPSGSTTTPTLTSSATGDTTTSSVVHNFPASMQRVIDQFVVDLLAAAQQQSPLRSSSSNNNNNNI